MTQLDAEVVYGRSRELFVDLLKLGLSLSTGTVAALSFLAFDEKVCLDSSQIKIFIVCLSLLLCSNIFGIIGWFAQAMFYTAWASEFPSQVGKATKWRIIRNVGLSGFALLFVLGIVAAGIFISDYLLVRAEKAGTYID